MVDLEVLKRGAGLKNHPASYSKALAGMGVFLFFSESIQVAAQGTFIGTGQGQAFTTRQIQADFGAAAQPFLSFDFGFATDEVFAPATLFDSFTISFAGVGGQPIATLVTADASGFVWAPATMGGHPLNSATILRSRIAFPNSGRAFRSEEAYTISVGIPLEFGRQGLNVTFDLIDNLDANNSLAFFTTPIIVPEPSSIALLALGSWLVFCRLRSK